MFKAHFVFLLVCDRLERVPLKLNLTPPLFRFVHKDTLLIFLSKNDLHLI